MGKLLTINLLKMKNIIQDDDIVEVSVVTRGRSDTVLPLEPLGLPDYNDVTIRHMQYFSSRSVWVIQLDNVLTSPEGRLI